MFMVGGKTDVNFNAKNSIPTDHVQYVFISYVAFSGVNQSIEVSSDTMHVALRSNFYI